MPPGDLYIYRRHHKKCPYRKDGRKRAKCNCRVWVDGFLNGIEIRKSLGTRNWEKATDIARRWEAGEDPQTTQAKPEPTTLNEGWDIFIADLLARNLSKSTIRKYHLLYRQMSRFASSKGLQFVKQFDLPFLTEFRCCWKDGPLSSLKKLERLKCFFRFAEEHKWVNENPACKLKAPKLTHRPTLPFSPDEVRRIIQALKVFRKRANSRGQDSALRLHALVLVLRYTGMRIGDSVKLTASEVNGNRLFVYTQKTGVPVNVLLPEFVAQSLSAVPRVTEERFFWNGVDSLDAVVGSWQRRLRKLFEIAKIENGHAHRFRDTFAVELLQAGVPLDRVSVLLGHKSVKITEKYYAAWTHARQEQIEADLARAWARDPLVILETARVQPIAARKSGLDQQKMKMSKWPIRTRLHPHLNAPKALKTPVRGTKKVQSKLAVS
jgi:integrase/recombinase XerD